MSRGEDIDPAATPKTGYLRGVGRDLLSSVRLGWLSALDNWHLTRGAREEAEAYYARPAEPIAPQTPRHEDKQTDARRAGGTVYVHRGDDIAIREAKDARWVGRLPQYLQDEFRDVPRQHTTVAQMESLRTANEWRRDPIEGMAKLLSETRGLSMDEARAAAVDPSLRLREAATEQVQRRAHEAQRSRTQERSR